jgi:hypothetical protein
MCILCHVLVSKGYFLRVFKTNREGNPCRKEELGNWACQTLGAVG